MRYSRAEFLRLGALAALPSLGCSVLDAPSYPNILVVVTDDQPFRSMPEMPKTTAALSPGVEFTRAYDTTPQCGPSRASIFTGLYVKNHGCKTNDDTSMRFKKMVRDDGLRNVEDHVALHLRGQGYATGLFGKWLNHYEDMPGHVPPGYSTWKCTFRVRDQIRANSNGRLFKPDTTQSRETGWLIDRALAFMAESKKRGVPFFCFVSINSPHAPYTPTQASKDFYAGKPLWNGSPPANFDVHDPNKPGFIRKDAGSALTTSQKAAITTEWRGKMAEIRDVDNALGALFSGVDFSDTYAFFLTDNGYLLGEHRLREKNLPYEEAARTPLFLRGPGLMENAQVSALAANVDIAPTVYEMAGLDTLAEEKDGRSLLGPAIGADAYPWRKRLYLERFENRTGASADIPGWRGIREEGSLYVEWDTGDRELYDMAADPHQLTNLAPGADAATMADLSRKLETMRAASGEELRAAEA